MRWLIVLMLFAVLAAGLTGFLPLGSGPTAPDPYYGRKPSKTLAASDTTKALSGDRIVIDGTEMSFRGLNCPAPDTLEGRNAKALVNTFLRVGEVRCTMTRIIGGPWRGDCLANGKDVATAMKDSGLCR